MIKVYNKYQVLDLWDHHGTQYMLSGIEPVNCKSSFPSNDSDHLTVSSFIAGCACKNDNLIYQSGGFFDINPDLWEWCCTVVKLVMKTET